MAEYTIYLIGALLAATNSSISVPTRKLFCHFLRMDTKSAI